MATAYILADDCSVPSIYVDFHSRATDDDFNFQYGLFMGVGTPSQNQSLWPSLSHNETTFSSDTYCSTSSYAQCKNETHGFYVPSNSQTFHQFNDYESLDSQIGDPDTIEVTGTDNLNIFTHYFDPSPPNLTVVPNLPVTVYTGWNESTSPWFSNSGVFGIGPSSTTIQELYKAGRIPSRSFGLYLGSAYPRAGGAMNGSLTLGGYDSQRFEEPVYNYTLSAMESSGSTPFKVSVASVSLIQGPNNSTTTLNDAPFDAYLTTSQHDLTLPETATQKFVDLTHATIPPSNSFGDSSLALPADFSGFMIINLTSGLSVTLPSEVLRNASNLSPITAPSSSTSSAALLGGVFLSYVYLFAQYDSNSFQLATALQEGQFVLTQTLCDGTLPTAYVSPRVNSFAASGLIGAVIGGVIGGLGIGFTAWYLLRRHLIRRERRKNGFTPELNGKPMTKLDASRNPLQVWRHKRSTSSSRKKSVRFSPNVDQEAGIVLQTYNTSPEAKGAKAVVESSTREVLSTQTSDASYLPPRTVSILRSSSIADTYANVPLTPNTPLPLLGHGSQGHSRTNSDDMRRELGLSVKTELAPAPKKKFAELRRERKLGRIRRLDDASNGMVGKWGRKMFPIS